MPSASPSSANCRVGHPFSLQSWAVCPRNKTGCPTLCGVGKGWVRGCHRPYLGAGTIDSGREWFARLSLRMTGGEVLSLEGRTSSGQNSLQQLGGPNRGFSFPPFAKPAKDGAPTSSGWATRQRVGHPRELGWATRHPIQVYSEPGSRHGYLISPSDLIVK